VFVLLRFLQHCKRRLYVLKLAGLNNNTALFLFVFMLDGSGEADVKHVSQVIACDCPPN
jgi:hypothetical protein